MDIDLNEDHKLSEGTIRVDVAEPLHPPSLRRQFDDLGLIFSGHDDLEVREFPGALRVVLNDREEVLEPDANGYIADSVQGWYDCNVQDRFGVVR